MWHTYISNVYACTNVKLYIIKYIYIWVCLKMRLPGREVCLRGLFRGSVSWYVSRVCFGGLFRTVLLPRTVKFKGSVSGSVSKVCFGVCFGGLFRQSRTSQPYLKLHSPKKCKPIYYNHIIFTYLYHSSIVMHHMLSKQKTGRPRKCHPESTDQIIFEEMNQS